MTDRSKPTILPAERDELLTTLKNRFEKNMSRHQSLEWAGVLAKLEESPAKVNSLLQMEKSGGEPDVIGFDTKTSQYLFCDCSPESPSGRRSLCFDDKALQARKEHKPRGSAVKLAAEMGIELLTEEQYRYLQSLGEFDTKTSSWIQTPDKIRKLGGAVFADRRYDTVFVYHNGAISYYAARGFRGLVTV